MCFRSGLMTSSFGKLAEQNNRPITQKFDEAHSACLNKVLDMTAVAARNFFLSPSMCLAAAVAALAGLWIPVLGGVSALLWDRYSNGQWFSSWSSWGLPFFRPSPFVLLI